MTRLVVGVDGGGSGSRAVLLDDEGRERARTHGAPVVADGRSDGPAVAEVVRLCRALLAEVGVEAPVEALWVGLAGAGREGPRAAVEEGVRKAELARRLRVGTDVEVAFQDAFGEEPGILLIAGTGSVAWGRSRKGREGRSGGWGPVLGDEGSGYALGLAGLRAVVQADDGRGSATKLRDALLAELELPVRGSETEIPHRLVEWVQAAPRHRVAQLAPVVARLAVEGDAVASAIVRHAVEALVSHVTALERGLGPWADPPRVALGGGLLAPGRPLSEPVARALMDAGFQILAGSPDGALGAAELARTLVGRASG
jgi:glucosamine kinase